MHAKQSQPPLQPQSGGTERPLATSAFKGQARLRELEHLAETARKVRDQAASELTRGGSTHHIARDRISAAERMLTKTQKEIAELRAQLGQSANPRTIAQSPKPKDFELAMMLGHSKASFNRDEAGQTAYEIQQDGPARYSHKTAGTGTARKTVHSRITKATGSAWRNLSFAVLLSIGAGLGAAGTYLLATTGSLSEASQVLRTETLQLVDRVRTLIPVMTLPINKDRPALTLHDNTDPTAFAAAVAIPPMSSPQKTQEQQARAAAEQRLARQTASVEKAGR